MRIVHRASGAVGRAVEHRSQRQNKIAAFRLAFRAWVRMMEAARLEGKPSIDVQIDRWMDPKYLVVEARTGNGRWERLP